MSVASDGKAGVDENKTFKQYMSEQGTTGGGALDGFGGWAIVKMLFWVVLVTAAIYVLAKVIKRYIPAAKGVFGTASLKIVGRTFLSPKQSIVVVKVGKRMVLVGVTPTEIRALSEITDPDEVEQMNREIGGTTRGAATREFQQDLKEARKEFESGRELLESTPGASEGRELAPDAKQKGLIDGIRQELDGISKKINIWRKTAD